MSTITPGTIPTIAQARARSVKSFAVETWYSGRRQAYMALERITCSRCGHIIPPGAHFTRCGAVRACATCYTCVPFHLPNEAKQWITQPQPN